MKLVFSMLVFGFLFSVASFAAPPKKETPELLAKGKTVFAANCVMCHGEKGDGNGPAGAMMNPKPRNLATEKYKKGEKPEEIFASITKGLEGTAMAPFGFLPEDDRWALAYYVKAFKKK